MKIKLAVLEKDEGYLKRLAAAFETKYAEQIEMYSFTEMDIAISMLSSLRIDVLLANDAFNVDMEQIPKRCGFAYFVEFSDIDMQNGQKAVGKFQKIDLIYKQILSIYAENDGRPTVLQTGDHSARTIAFLSPCGGVGTSSMAAACAMHFAMQNKKTLYLNIEKFGSADLFFSAEGQFDMSDIVFALKAKKKNLLLILESYLKQDPCGVAFFSKSKHALDMMELNAEDAIRLISELKRSGSFESIIVDMDFMLSKDAITQMDSMDAIVMVSDGTLAANSKLLRALEACTTCDESLDTSLMSKTCVAYNKFSNKTGKILEGINVREIGGIPRFEGASLTQVVKALSEKQFFDEL